MRWMGLTRWAPWVVFASTIDPASAQVPNQGNPRAGAPAQIPSQPAHSASPAASAAAPSASALSDAKAPDPAAVARMDALLRSWEQRSQGDLTLYAEFERKDRSVAFPGEKVYLGKALLKRPNLACLEFNEQVQGQ